MDMPAEQQFLQQVTGLGFIYQEGEDTNYIRSPMDSQHWHLHQESDRWILCVRDVPQIVFYPHEVIKFLQKQPAQQMELNGKHQP